MLSDARNLSMEDLMLRTNAYVIRGRADHERCKTNVAHNPDYVYVNALALKADYAKGACIFDILFM
jgi:hypothetical protein